MKKLWFTAVVLVLMLIVLAGCGKKGEESEAADAGIPVEVQTVSMGSISTENKLSGTVLSDKTEQVYVSLSARCMEVYAEAGDAVKAGEVLCKLDLGAFHDNYELAELNYNNARQSYDDQTKLQDQQIAQLEKNYNNTLALLEIGAASQLEVDGAKLALDSARVGKNTALSQLELAMKNAQKSMDQVTDTLKNVDGNGEVKSPINGTVVSIAVGRDSFVSAGMPVAVIESTQDIKIGLSVSERLLPKLKVGDAAQVQISALGESFEGKISDIAQAVNPTNRLYAVNVSVPAGVPGLVSGMFADVSIYTDSRENTVVIPTEALLVQEGGQCVVLLNEDNTARRVPVETGLIGDGVTEITSGLSGGETIVTVGQSYLIDGALARIVPAQE